MILKIRATIPESKVFFRVYEVKGDMTLFKFNSFILGDLGFAPDQMIVFEGYDAEGTLRSEYGMFDLGDGAIDKVTFEDIMARGETEVRYVFDLRSERYVKLVFEGECDPIAMRAYPCLVEEKGHNPDQFSAKYEEYEELPKAPSKAYPKDEGDDLDDDLDDEDEDEDEEEDDETEEIFDEDEFSGKE